MTNISSENGLLIRNILERVQNSFGEIPGPYKRVIKGLWSYVSHILIIEVTQRWLPHDFAELIKKLIEISEETFNNAPHRYQSQYFDWPDRSKEKE